MKWGEIKLHYILDCSSRVAHQWSFSAFQHNHVRDIKTYRVGEIKDGATNEDHVLSIYDNGSVDLGDFSNTFVDDPRLSDKGLSVAFWLNYKGGSRQIKLAFRVNVDTYNYDSTLIKVKCFTIKKRKKIC